jgi:hypothetical protein
MCRKSNTDNEEPKRHTPKTDIADPNRAKLRSDKEEDICTKSRTDMDAPKRAMPNTDRADPRRAMLLRENELPKCE